MKTTLILCLSIIAFYFLGCSKENNPVKISDKEPINEKPSVSLINPVATTEIFDSVLVKIEATDNKGITKVEFYVNNSIAKVFYTPPYEFYWTITTIEDSLNYSIYAKAYDTDDNMSSTEVIIVNVKRLIAPTKLRFTNINDGSVRLEWDDNSQWESGYIVELSKDSVNYAEIARIQPNITTYIVSQLDTSSEYYFRVSAYKNDKISPYSNILVIDWKLVGLELDEILIANFNSTARLITWNSQANLLCISTYNSKIIIYDISNRTIKYTFNGLYFGAISPDGQYFVGSYSGSSGVQIRSLLTGELIKNLIASAKRFSQVSFYIDNDFVVAKGMSGGFDFWKVGTGEYFKYVNTSLIFNGGTFSKDGQLFVGSSDGYFGVQSTNDNGFFNYSAPNYDIWSYAISDDSKHIASGHRDSLVVIYDTGTQTIKHELQGNHNSRVQSIAFANNKNIIATGGFKTIVLYDLITGEKITKLDGFDGLIYSLSFSDDGNQLVIDDEGSLELWKVKYSWAD